MQIALLGLSNIGYIIVDKLLSDGHEVIVWNNNRDSLEELRTEKAEFIVSQKLALIHTIDELQTLLRKPNVIFSSMPVGEPTETLLNQISNFSEAGDVIVDLANSNFKDTERRFDEFEKKGIKYLGIGVTGGVHAFENGFCMMAGGNADGYNYIAPILDSLAKPDAVYSYFGTGGAGHFMAMVHAGIEAGMTQAVAEGIAILRKSDYQIDPIDAANVWQDGSIISSFVLEMAIDGISHDPTLAQFDGIINQSNLNKLAVENAKLSSVTAPVIENSVELIEKSQYDKVVQESVVAKIIQAMKREIDGNN